MLDSVILSQLYLVNQQTDIENVGANLLPVYKGSSWAPMTWILSIAPLVFVLVGLLAFLTEA